LFPASLTAKRKAAYAAPSCRQGCSRLRHWPRPLLERPSSSRLRLLNLYTRRVSYVPSKRYYAPRRARKYAPGPKARKAGPSKMRARRSPEDRCQSAGRTFADLILGRYGEGERTFSPALRGPATMRIPVLVRMPAAGSSTSPPAETTRRPRRRLLAGSPRPGSTAAEQTPQTALQHGPGHQPVLVGYGDYYRASLPAVVAF
jgi:hypothetical protein